MYQAKRAGRNRWVWSQTPTPKAEPTAKQNDEQVAVKPSATFVAHSLLSVPTAGRSKLLAAFTERLGQVDDWPGSQRLEVWSDRVDATSLVMVSWWDNESAFKAYMASNDHHDSHVRIPDCEMCPRPQRFTGYDLFAR
ncbi:MAG: antibiotic biosynthesis monooxygenase family protein [Nitriliruptoraceae bacterium]